MDITSKRIEKYQSLFNHPYYRKIMKGLNKEAHSFIVGHIKANETTYHKTVNRVFLDKKYKPKKWTTIEEIILICQHG